MHCAPQGARWARTGCAHAEYGHAFNLELVYRQFIFVDPCLCTHARDTHAKTRARRTPAHSRCSEALLCPTTPPPRFAGLRMHTAQQAHPPGLSTARGGSRHGTYAQTARAPQMRVSFRHPRPAKRVEMRHIRRAPCFSRPCSVAGARQSYARTQSCSAGPQRVQAAHLHARRPGLRTTRLHPRRHLPAAPSALLPHRQRCVPPPECLHQARIACKR